MLSLVNTKCEPLPSVWNRDAVLIKKKKKNYSNNNTVVLHTGNFFFNVVDHDRGYHTVSSGGPFSCRYSFVIHKKRLDYGGNDHSRGLLRLTPNFGPSMSNRFLIKDIFMLE